MDYKDILRTAAPWLATALTGPLGGIAVGFIADKLGLPEKTVDSVKAAVMGMTPEQQIQLQQADKAFQVHMAELEITSLTKLAELEVQDVSNARQREIATQDSTNKTLAYIVIGAFIGVVITTLMGYAKADSVLAGTLIGYLSAKAEQVLSYYFGSTKNSARKTELLAKTDGGPK